MIMSWLWVAKAGFRQPAMPVISECSDWLVKIDLVGPFNFGLLCS